MQIVAKQTEGVLKLLISLLDSLPRSHIQPQLPHSYIRGEVEGRLRDKIQTNCQISFLYKYLNISVLEVQSFLEFSCAEALPKSNHYSFSCYFYAFNISRSFIFISQIIISNIRKLLL